MIKILERYITKTIVYATLFTTLIIAGLVCLLSLLSQLKVMGEGDYNLFEAISYTLLRLPNELYQFAPLLVLLGSIVGLSILSSHRELAVMRTSGFSIRRIVLSVVFAALILISFLTIIGEGLAPKLSYKAEVQKENARNAGQAVVTSAGIWLHVDNNFIHVQRVIGRQLLEGVTRYQFDNEHRLQAAYFAKTLAYENDTWQMQNVVATTFYKDQTKSATYPKLDLNLKFNVNLLNVGLVEPNEMTLPKLIKFVHYLKQNRLQASEYEYDFWRRIFQPVSALIMIFLAIPFVLGVLSTSTLGWRLVVGILIGFSFFILNSLLGQMSIVFQMPPVFAAAFPLIIFGAFSFLLFKRVVRR